MVDMDMNRKQEVVFPEKEEKKVSKLEKND